MAYTLRQAARRAGKGKSTLLRAVHSGKLTAIRDELTNTWLIEPAELDRLYPLPVHNGAVEPPYEPPHGAPRTAAEPDRTALLASSLAGRIAALEAERERDREASRLRDETIADLRRRLDESERERREQAARIVALLSDQRSTPPPPAPAPAPPVPAWRARWPWRRA